MWQKADGADHLRTVAGNIPIHHRYSVGIAGERFFRALRDEHRILASRCPSCRNAYLPPKIYCEECFEGTTDWVEVEGLGYVETFTLVHTSLDGRRLNPPEAVGFITWKGISGGLIHRIKTDSPAIITPGMAVQPVWAEPCAGGITDILHFKEADRI